MNRYTAEQRTKIIELYFENYRSIVMTKRPNRRFSNVRTEPSEPKLIN